MSPPIATKVWLSRAELADRLGIPPSTLARWASRRPRYGPDYALFGRHARYRLDRVIAWETQQLNDVPAAEPTDDMSAAEPADTAP